MPDSLEVRRGPTRRETTVYVVAILGVLGMLLVGWLWVHSAIGTLSGNAGPGTTGLVTGTLGLVLQTAILGGIVLSSAVSWQLVLRPGNPDDVVLRFDADGLGMFDAGSRVFVPWYAVRSLTTEPLAGGYRMRVITDGPVQGGRDRLSALITRALRKKGMTFRFSPDEPDHDLLARSVEQMSAGRFRLAPLS